MLLEYVNWEDAVDDEAAAADVDDIGTPRDAGDNRRRHDGDKSRVRKERSEMGSEQKDDCEEEETGTASREGSKELDTHNTTPS